MVSLYDTEMTRLSLNRSITEKLYARNPEKLTSENHEKINCFQILNTLKTKNKVKKIFSDYLGIPDMVGSDQPWRPPTCSDWNNIEEELNKGRFNQSIPFQPYKRKNSQNYIQVSDKMFFQKSEFCIRIGLFNIFFKVNFFLTFLFLETDYLLE